MNLNQVSLKIYFETSLINCHICGVNFGLETHGIFPHIFVDDYGFFKVCPNCNKCLQRSFEERKLLLKTKPICLSSLCRFVFCLPVL